MTNIFVEKFKKIVTDYFNDVSALRAKAKYNSVTFKPTIAQDYNASLEQEITNKGNHAISEIDTIFTDVKQRISISNFPHKENLGDDCVIKSGILTAEEINVLLKKYYSEYNFVKIRKIVSEYPKIAETMVIQTASDYVSAYRDFAVGAVKLILSMRENPRFSKVELDCFADENFASNLYAVIGSGQALISTTVTDKNEFMSHTFDDIVLEVPSDSFTFAFKGIR